MNYRSVFLATTILIVHKLLDARRLDEKSRGYKELYIVAANIVINNVCNIFVFGKYVQERRRSIPAFNLCAQGRTLGSNFVVEVRHRFAKIGRANCIDLFG